MTRSSSSWSTRYPSATRVLRSLPAYFFPARATTSTTSPRSTRSSTRGARRPFRFTHPEAIRPFASAFEIPRWSWSRRWTVRPASSSPTSTFRREVSGMSGDQRVEGGSGAEQHEAVLRHEGPVRRHGGDLPDGVALFGPHGEDERA